MSFFQMIEVDIPQSLFEEQGRQLYGANLLEIQVLIVTYLYQFQNLILSNTVLLSMISIQEISASSPHWSSYWFWIEITVTQSKVKLNEQQLASLSSPKAVNEYLEHQKDNITKMIKQNLAVGDIYRRENLQVSVSWKYLYSQGHEIIFATNSPPSWQKK